MKRFNLGFGFWFGLVVVVIFGGVLWFMFHQEAAKKDFLTTASTREIALSCTTDMATTFHIHPELKIVFNGVEQKVPADLGITNNCMHPLHTHDDTGLIHVESPVKRDFTLGDFFTVWDKPFSKSALLDKTVTGTATLKMSVNGVSNDAFENYVVQDKDQILLEYSSK